MTHEQKLVRDWMQKFGQNCPDKPTVPTLEERRLRAKLQIEECFEIIEALGFRIIKRGDKGSEVLFTDLDFLPVKEPDLIAIADGCADLKVVTIGTEVACGIDGDSTFKEVMRSNDSKLWTTEEIDHWRKSNRADMLLHSIHYKGGAGHTEPTHRVYLVKDKDGKVVKSPSHSRPNLTPLLQPQSKPE